MTLLEKFIGLEPEIPSLMKPEKQDFLSMHLIN